MDATPAPAGRRLVAATAAVLTVVAALTARAVVGGEAAKYLGDALYTLLLVWLVMVVAPRTRPWVAATAALLLSVAAELFQLTGVPAALSGNLLARLVLGSTFNAPDLAWYVAGALTGLGLVTALTARDARTAQGGTGVLTGPSGEGRSRR